MTLSKQQPTRLVLGGLLASGIALAAVTIGAQAPPAADVPGAVKGYTAPKTPWGDPDLQGIWPGIELVGVPMARQASFGTRNWLTDEEFKQRQANAERVAAQDLEEFDLGDTPPGGAVGGPVSPPPHWLERGTPQRIASLIVDPPDGQMPPTTEKFKQLTQARNKEAQARRATLEGREADSYTDRSIYDRCITRGIAGSFLPVIYNNGNEIIQGPGWVALRNEMIHETRIAPLDNRPRLNGAITSWMGDSRAHWEGNTLVVETTNFNDRTSGIGVNGGGTRGTELMKVTERITRVGPELLVWDMTFEDPNVWTRPWTIRLPLKLDNSYIMAEYACHEGNYTMFNILSGARADEKLQREAAAKGLPNPLLGGRGGGADGGGRGGGRGGRDGGPGGAGRGQAPN
jgi:hypothetical protein